MRDQLPVRAERREGLILADGDTLLRYLPHDLASQRHVVLGNTVRLGKAEAILAATAELSR